LNTIGSVILPPGNGSADEFELRLILALYVVPVNPEGDSGEKDISWRKAVRIVKWPEKAFETFKAQAKSRSEKFWSFRFRFWPPDNYPYLNWPSGRAGKPRAVSCTLSINYTLTIQGASHKIRCYRRASGEVTAALDSGNWTDAVLTDQPHDFTDSEGNKIPTVNNTLAHEVGHLMGLSHPVCNGDELRCYGDGGQPWQIRNIMGAGDIVNRSNATPWLERIARHTGVPESQWTVHTLDDNGNPLYL